MRGKWLLIVRRLHLYLSVFFAPLLLLFIVTGWAQTIGFAHEATPTVLQKLTDIHKGDYFPGPDEDYGTKKFAGYRLAGLTGTGKGGRERLTWPTRYLVVAMCIALITSISLGLLLAFTMVRNRIPVWIALILGIATPVFFLALAHFR